jgi:ABC-type nitrate/sulfonate/bicarbonate transport system permease component
VVGLLLGALTTTVSRVLAAFTALYAIPQIALLPLLLVICG